MKKKAWRKERNRAKKRKKAESEFLRKGKASKKVRTKNSKQGKRNFKAHERRENKSEEERRRQAKEKGKASERKGKVLKRKVQKRNFEMVLAAAGFLWLHFVSTSFFLLAAGQHSQPLTVLKKEGIAYIYRLNFTYQFDYNCHLAS